MAALFIGKMIMPRLALGVHWEETLVQRHMIVLVLVQRLPESLHDAVGVFGIAGAHRPQRCPFHMRSRMRLMRRHGFYRTMQVFVVLVVSHRRPRDLTGRAYDAPPRHGPHADRAHALPQAPTTMSMHDPILCSGCR